MTPGLYAYAIARARHPLPAGIEAIDASENITSVSDGPLAAFCTPVDLDDYSQQVIDARANDIDWIGAIGYRHQAVMSALLHDGTILPLRAFSLFANDDALRSQLREHRDEYLHALERLEGKREWTLRIEFEPLRWSDALIARVESLRLLAADLAAAAPGKAFLLRKKLDEEKKRASREAEKNVATEVETLVMEHLSCELVAETRQQRDGAFPQINLLIDRDEEATLRELYDDLAARYSSEGVSFAITGPWPPYTFAGTITNG